MRTFTLSLLMATAFFHPAMQAQAAPMVPAPAEVLGFEPGQWHARHDQLWAPETVSVGLPNPRGHPLIAVEPPRQRAQRFARGAEQHLLVRVMAG